MRTEIVVDVGSHSIKTYKKTFTGIELIRVTTWEILESRLGTEAIEKIILSALHGFNERHIQVIGTEALRRNLKIKDAVKSALKKVDVELKVISQNREAQLIKKAFLTKHKGANGDIVNVGGGSIQIMSLDSGRKSLYKFGISDLNKKFKLNSLPEKRMVDECIFWLMAQFKNLSCRPFWYTGSESKYLKHLGVPLTDKEYCRLHDFQFMAQWLHQTPRDFLQALSPFDRPWMNGAIASNCIALALMKSRRQSGMYASNFNISHGLILEVCGE